MSSIFLDTNVLVYAFDHGDPAKRLQAIQLIQKLEDSAADVWISTQVMQEFYNALTRKLHIAPGDAIPLLRDLKRLKIVSISPDMTIIAAGISDSAKISFWDALIVVAAQTANCGELLSEDLNAKQVFGKTEIVNPFEIN